MLLVGNAVLAQGGAASNDAYRQQERAIVDKVGPLEQQDLEALSRIGASLRLEDRTLARVTEKMAGGLNAFETRPVVSIFTAYQKHAPLPDSTFDFLLEFMLTLSEISYVAADSLQVMPVANAQRSRAIVALNERLRAASDPRETLYTIAYLERFQRNGPLTDDSVAALLEVIGSSAEFGLRKRALDLARTQQPSELHKRAIFDVLLREIVPDPEAGDDLYSSDSVRTRSMNPELTYILQALVELSGRPYPPVLVDLLVTHFPRYPALGLQVFADFRKTHDFSTAQQEMLRRWATSESVAMSGNTDTRVAMRSKLIGLLWPPPDRQAFTAAAVTLAFSTDFPSRCRAYYDIRRFFGDAAVPGDTAASIHEVLLDEVYPELRFVGGELLLRADAPFEQRERWLLDLIAEDNYEDGLENLLLDAYDTPTLQRFIAANAGNAQLPARFRQSAVTRLEKMAGAGGTLPADTEAALVSVVLKDQDMTLGTAESALQAWGIEAPLSDRMRTSKRHQLSGKIAGSLFLGLTVVSPLVFLYGLIAIPLSRSRHGQSTSGTVWSIVGWVVLALLTLLAWLYALIVSFGIHGGGAPPEEHLLIMLPFYLLSVVLLIVAFVVSRKMYGGYRGAARESTSAH